MKNKSVASILTVGLSHLGCLVYGDIKLIIPPNCMLDHS